METNRLTMKTKNVMMKTKKLMYVMLAVLITFTACKKDDPIVIIDDPINGEVTTITAETTELSGQMKGTLLAGKTYIMTGDLIIPENEEIVAEAGVTIIVQIPTDGIGYEITNHGSFISLGTQQNPNLISVPENMRTDANIFAGLWGGIQCSDKAKAVVLKWTRMEYMGGEGGPGTPRAGKIRYGLWTLSDQTEVVMENCWIYGVKDDFWRPVGGKIHVVGNTFEFCGEDGGDVVNVKGGTVGNIAYNVVIGSATNAFKPSDDGESTIQSNIGIFNNTILNGGHRRAGLNRGSNINFENGARGFAYNNLLVNNKNGIRILADADIQNISYDYTLYYAVAQELLDQIPPQDSESQIQPNDIVGNTPGDNDPLFVNYDVTQFTYAQLISGENQPLHMNRMTNNGVTYNLRLSPGSPAIGAGHTNFSLVPVQWVHLSGDRGPSPVSPSVDLGAYPTNGSGNRHN
jgi:hypothetical protein